MLLLSGCCGPQSDALLRTSLQGEAEEPEEVVMQRQPLSRGLKEGGRILLLKHEYWCVQPLGFTGQCEPKHGGSIGA